MIELIGATFSDVQLGFMGFGLLLLLITCRLPLGLALFFTGLLGLWLVDGRPQGANTRLADEVFSTFTRHSFTIIPLFLLMGEFALRGGLGRSLFDAAAAWFGHRRGGIGMAAIGASAGFGAVCGSSLATASTMGRVALPELRRLGYAGGFSTGTLAAGGTLGILIPPSLLLLIYSILAEQNIEKLFTAAYIPGLMAALGYGLVVWAWPHARAKSPTKSPTKSRDKTPGARSQVLPRVPYAQRFAALRPVWPVAAIFALMLAGMSNGWFSPTTAASIGASGTGLIVLAQGRLGLRDLGAALLSALKTAAMIMFIVVGANTFNAFLASSGVPTLIADFFLVADLSPWLILVGMLLVYLLLGMVMDSLAMVFLTVPIFLPVVLGLDFGFATTEETAIWFGILVLMAAEIGLITPPVGLNLFVINALAKDVPLTKTYAGVLPFIATDLVRLALLVAFPFLSLWLVRLAFTFVG